MSIAGTGWETDIPENPEEANDILGALPQDLVNKLNTERVELAQKIERLKTFITLDAKYTELDYYDQKLLKEQLMAMNSYESVLVERLTLLNQKNED